jgi:7 transmembrane receptor (rhodopsin family)
MSARIDAVVSVSDRAASPIGNMFALGSASGKLLPTVSGLILSTDVAVGGCTNSSSATAVDIACCTDDVKAQSQRTPTAMLVSRDTRLVIAGLVLLSLTCVTSLIGNSLILARLRRLVRQPGKTLGRMNTMILHLCIADLFVAAFNVLPQIGRLATDRFQGNDVLCRVIHYVQVATMYASSYVLLTTAVDRYLAICHPLRSYVYVVNSFACNAYNKKSKKRLKDHPLGRTYYKRTYYIGVTRKSFRCLISGARLGYFLNQRKITQKLAPFDSRLLYLSAYTYNVYRQLALLCRYLAATGCSTA